MTLAYDALLIVSFGGPEGPDEVIPFLENVLKGRSVPRERMLQVAEHYKLFGGVSPLNQQNRELIASLKKELHERGPDLPIYWGNRNWHPLLADTVQQMRDDGIKQALAFVTSAYSSYSSCRQYRENIAEAHRIVGAEALRIDKLRPFYNHPLFLQANVENIGFALDQVPKPRRRATPLIFTAHSIPDAMAMNCMYAQQLHELSELIAAKLNQPFALVYQSRSGSPSQPWLGPDICDFLRTLSEDAVKDVVVAPIGFVSDHMEIVFDLDTQAREVANELGMNMVRAATVGTHPLFIKMIRELILERLEETERESVGTLGALPHVCPVDCCLPAQTRPPR